MAVSNGRVDQTVLSGLTFPTNVEFAPDGRVFVAEKSGIVKVFDSIFDPTPDVFADLSANVHNFWDRGLLGLAICKRIVDDAGGAIEVHNRRAGGA